MSEPYFPNLPAADMALERELRRITTPLPELARYELYSVYTRAQPRCVPTEFVVEDDFVGARQAGETIWFPRPLPMVKYGHVSCGYREWLRRKYSLPGFVAVEPGDIVIDCGAYVGGFTLGTSEIAAQVHAFEPEARNFEALRRNTESLPNVTANHMGLYNRAGTAQFNISASSVEHSMLQPDDGEAIAVVEIPLATIGGYLRDKGVTGLDFLKLEAEGVELEIFEGLDGLRPRKLAIDVSAERNNESPAGRFMELLGPLGYETQRRGHVLFARLDGAAA